MLKILQGDFCPDRTDALFAELGKEIGKGKRVFLVVPEQQTLLAEKEAARRLLPSSALNFEVTNPSRLANSVFRTKGGIAGEYADGTASALLMWRTLSESQNSLSHAVRGTVTAGSVAKALRAVKEMDSLGLDAGILKATAEGMAGTGGRLENKLLDLSVILAGYRDRLKEKYSDVAEDIVGLTEKVRNDPSVFEGAVFWFDGFTSFTEPQYEFLKVLIEIAEVNVCLILPKGSEDAYEFSECRRTDKRLTELAKSVFAETPRGIIGSHLCKHEGLTALSRVIWRNTGSLTEEEITDLTSCMKIVKTKNPHEEAAYLSSDIKSRVMAGARYRDFAVIMRNAEDYLGFVDVSFAENGIPAFIANKRDVTSFEAVKLIRAAYRCVSAHFDRTDVLAYAKCALSGISRDECDEFELYTELWNINHGQFTSEVRWNMNPEGYTDRINPGNAAALDRLNGIRHRLIAPLEILAGDSEGERTVEDHAKNLLDFLIKIDLETSLEARAEALKKQGEDELAEENLRLWDCILSVLEKLVFVLGDFKADAKTFTTLLDLAFSSIDIGRIPSFADEVTVGSADLIRLPEKKYVYLLGVNQGEFPSAALSESYFSEKEKQTLSALGLKTQPEGDVKLAREY
ncbi:MAG: hypothetical protein MJ082_06150, partial [Clostridia bacterium]|nr:hypothetical protein [Clostridia bacterium]